MNETGVKESQQRYSSSMNDWLKEDATPFATLEEINQKQQEICEKLTNDLKNHLKGPTNEFKESFVTQLQQVI